MCLKERQIRKISDLSRLINKSPATYSLNTPWLQSYSADPRWKMKARLHKDSAQWQAPQNAPEFACTRLGETPSKLAQRVRRVERHMNSDVFAKEDGGRGLMSLAKELNARCKHVVKLRGARIPK